LQGVICLEGVANKCAFQGVHMLCDMAELEAEWGADEERVNQLVFIGRNLDRASLEAGVTACLTTVEQ
jgi:G3E family GTPase